MPSTRTVKSGGFLLTRQAKKDIYKLMRIAAIYDIHANLNALESVLEIIEKNQVDSIVVGGDVVSGPLPNEVLSVLRRNNVTTHYILGNAESDVLRYLAGHEINGMSERANEEARWVASVLTDSNKQFLSSWQSTIEVEVRGLGSVLFCHGTPRSNVEIFTSTTSEEKLLPLFAGLSTSLVVCGHTHIQFDRKINGIRVVNAGSVGMPFGHRGADWILIDSEVAFKHTEYDYDAAAKRILESNYSHAEEFVFSNILASPSEEKMLAMMKRMELT